MSRLNYLLGKWLGVLAVNAVILVGGRRLDLHLHQVPRASCPWPRAWRGRWIASPFATRCSRPAWARAPVDRRHWEPVQLRGPRRADDQARSGAGGSWRRCRWRSSGGWPARCTRRLHRGPAHLSCPSIAQRPLEETAARTSFEGLGPARNLQSTLTLRYRFHILRRRRARDVSRRCSSSTKIRRRPGERNVRPHRDPRAARGHRPHPRRRHDGRHGGQPPS